MSGTGSADVTPVIEQPADGTPLPADASASPGGAADTSDSPGATDEGSPSGAAAPAAEGAAGVDGAPAAPAATADAAKPQDSDPNASWKAKKYDRIYAQLQQAKEELAAAQAGKPVVDQAEIDRRAAAQAATADFNRRCNEVAAEGKKSFQDFNEKIGNLRQVVTVKGDAQQEAAYGRMIEAVLETGSAAARITYELGSNLELAEEIMNLSPVKQAARLAELAAKKGEPEPSAAPKPITPVGQRAGAGELIKPEDASKADKLSTKEWMARRQADIDKKRQAGMRIW